MISIENLYRAMPPVFALAFAFAIAPVAFGQPSSPPAPLAERPVEFPAFQEMTLPNGLDVVVVEHFGAPVVNINLYVRGGETMDPADQAGRAGLVAELLTKGTATRTAQQIAETIEGVGGRLNASAGSDWMSVSSTVLVEHAPLAFELLQDVVLNPTFPEDELETIRRRTLSGLQAQLGQPGAIAQRRFLETIYGPHPYGVSAVPGTVREITRDDVVAFHSDQFAPGNSLLVVSGAISAAEAERLVTQHLGDWRTTAAVTGDLPAVQRRDATHIYLVHRPGSVQSNVWIGHEGLTPGHPDYFALLVLNKLLGQGADARLFQILREQKGWTYGAYSRFTRPADVGYFAATTEVRTEVTDSSVVEILHQLRRLQDDAIPEDEFQGAVSFLAGSFPLRIETPGQIASQVAQARLLGLSAEDVTEFRARILAVTQEDVRQAARTHIRPDAAAIVVVGDATQVLEGLERIAPVTLYDVEGRLLDREDLVVRAAEERFDASRLQAGTLTYQLMVQGNPLGTVTERLVREGDEWVATSSIESPVMAQSTELRFSAIDFSPVMVDQQVRQGPVSITTDLRVENGRIVGRAELPEQMGGPRDVDVEMVNGLLLPGMDSYVLSAADLEEGASITLPVYTTMTNAVTPVTYSVTGVEEVTVAAGTFNTFRIEVAGPQPMTVYARQEAPHIVVRQEFAGQPVAIELQSID
jgi:zinc protease